MMLTWKARYAVAAILDLAERFEGNVPIKLSDLSARQNISLTYLEQLFSKLKNRKLVDSLKGPGGGYVLAKHPKDITIIDIIIAVDESIKINGCESNNEYGCLQKSIKCKAHDLWEGLMENIKGYLASITIEDVLRNHVNTNTISSLNENSIGKRKVV